MRLSEKNTKINLYDILVFVFIILLSFSVLLFNRSSKSGTVHIQTASDSYTYSLSHNKVVDIDSNGHRLKLEINDKTITVLSSDCPDKICTNTGEIKNSGEVIICAPAKVIISIIGDDENENADIVAGRFN